MPGQTPHDLAVYVYGRIADKPHRPAIRILDELFHTMYLASMRREEGEAITCTLCYVNPKDPDPDPPPNIRDPRWTVALFSKPIDCTSAQLTKLALAADPSSSSLVVFPNRKNDLQIWGLIDQQGGYQSMLSHEAEGGWSPPGAFHVQVLGPGHLIVMHDYGFLAELNGDHLVEDSVNVFVNQTIQRKFWTGFERRIRPIETRVHETGYGAESDISADAYHQWIKTIKRILLRARTFGHGGAFLFTDTPSPTRLNTKYDLVYDRLPRLLDNVAVHSTIGEESWDLIDTQLQNDADSVDAQLYISNAAAEVGLEDAREALTGAIGYVASLSRVDGLVLLGYDLVVRGFGCEITANGDSKCQAFSASHATPSKGKLRRLDVQRFGTRHRSMVRYCTEDKDSVGFVVSHDGPVRAISCSSSRLYFWDNVKLSNR